jgi:hypothetical protein
MADLPEHRVSWTQPTSWGLRRPMSPEVPGILAAWSMSPWTPTPGRVVTPCRETRQADHHLPCPDLAVSPRRMRQRVAARQLGGRGPGRPRPRTLRLFARSGHGLPASPGPLGHDQRAEPRGQQARIDADHLEILEGPSRPSADFLHTRSSTAASPSAWVRSATGMDGSLPMCLTLVQD